MGIEHLHIFPLRALHRLGLRFLHGVQNRIQQVERNHHHHSGQRVGALELPGDPGGVPRDFLRPRLGVDSVGLDIARQSDVPDRIGIRIVVLEMRPLAGVRIGKDDLSTGFEAPCGPPR